MYVVWDKYKSALTSCESQLMSYGIITPYLQIYYMIFSFSSALYLSFLQLDIKIKTTYTK